MVLGQGASDEAKGFVNAIGCIRYTIGDKMAQVSQKAMQTLISICRQVNPKITNAALKGELFAYTEPIISALNDKLGDNLVKVRQLSEESFMALAEHSQFGVGACFNVLFRSGPDPSKKEGAQKKSVNSNKHVIGRYQVLLRMLQSFDITENGMVKDCVAFSLKGIQNNLQDVRNVAYKCMSELYRLVGPNIRQQCEGLRPAQMEQLEAAFAEVEGGPGF